MRRSVALQQQWRGSVEQEIADRVRVHQQRVARFKSARARSSRAGARPSPLVMLAHGDSWFDYPLTGNMLSFEDTDVIAQLRTMGNPNPIIDCVGPWLKPSLDFNGWHDLTRRLKLLVRR